MIRTIDSISINDNYFVYSLSDPITEYIKYIGISKNPKERYRKHLTCKGKSLKSNWIKSLLSKEQKPIMTLIDSCNTREEVNIKEKYWIIKYRDWGFDLKNMTDGGDGGNTFEGKQHTELTKKKISLANKGRKRDLSDLHIKSRKKVEQICPLTKMVINTFDSVKLASEITGISKTNIAKFANGTIKSTIKKVGGYEWRYCH